MEFTNGDMSMLPTLMKFDNLIGDNNEWLKKQKQVNEYLQPALELYFQNAGINVLCNRNYRFEEKVWKP
mgnify:CR=1 FL=1